MTALKKHRWVHVQRRTVVLRCGDCGWLWRNGRPEPTNECVPVPGPDKATAA